ncbi:MAG: UbiX family flavin prenyltransferase [Candidatus Kariarchaeaceae archaeon]|jgi:4-hydroxy-3-polyprenylbenzoate decarboxylase
MRIILAITGASGVHYGLKTLQTLVKLDHEVDLIISDSAKKILNIEYEGNYEEILKLATYKYDLMDIGAAIASGTHVNNGMIISPCSMKTLAAITSGFSQNLVHRAADCMLKEERKLILVLRETPLNAIHLENMLKAKRAGATILPATPGFYFQPKTIQDVINFVVGKTLNVFGIQHNLFQPWDPSKVGSD